MPKDPDGLEKLRLLGQLAGDDAKAAPVIRAAEPPNWTTLVQSSQITDEESKTLRVLDSSPDRHQELKRNSHLMDVLVNVLSTIDKDANAILYFTELLIDGCRSDSLFWDQLATFETPRGLTPHTACYKALERNWQDSSVNDNLAFLMCGLQSHYPAIPDARNLCKVIVDPKVIRMSPTGRLAALSNLLKSDTVRPDLFNSSTCRSQIATGFLSKDLNAMYHATVAFWLMTFNQALVADDGPLCHHRSILEAFCEMFVHNKKEKVVRVACFVLKNLVNIEWVYEVFFQKKIDHTLTLLEYEKWRDAELYDEIQEMSRIFYNKTLQYSNFTRYLKELDSGMLRPGPLHTEKFWRENLTAFEDNEFSSIKKLSALLNSSEPSTLSVAAFDLGEFCRLHPTGRQLIQKFGAKDQIIKLMSHPNKEVAREALLCTQKFMLDDWRRLGSEAQDTHQQKAIGSQ